MLDSLRLNSKISNPSLKIIDNAQIHNLPTHNKGEQFLRGPIPMKYIHTAAKLPGRALAVYIQIWHQAWMNNGKTPIKLSMKTLRIEFKMDRNAVYRALKALESANLISVNRHRGRCSIVTVLDQGKNQTSKLGEYNG